MSGDLKNKRIGKLEVTDQILMHNGATLRSRNSAGAESTIDLTELGVLDVTPGTATASKAVVLNSSKGIGTITSATITNLTTEAPITLKHATGITAFATGGQTSATALTAAFNNITTCATASDSVKLPAAALGLDITVRNSGAAALAVFPAASDAINSLAANLSVDIPPKGQLTFRTIDAVTWYTDEFLISQAPSTQKGSLIVKAADSAGNTVTTITNASQAAARTYTIPDAGANASFVMTEGAQTLVGVKTLSTGLAFGAGATLDADSAAVAATGNDTTQTATVTKMAGTITTGALTTAANATTDVVLTLTGVAANDLVLVTMAGGTNTIAVYAQSAIATTNTITVKLRNGINATTALNGTVAFHYLWMKA